MIKTLPTTAKKYFWGDDLKQLSWAKHSQYVTQTLLDKGDSESISWLLKQTTPQKILSILSSLKLNSKTKNFWKVYLS